MNENKKSSDTARTSFNNKHFDYSSKRQALTLQKRAYYLSKIIVGKEWYDKYCSSREEALKNDFDLSQEEIAALKHDVADGIVQLSCGNTFYQSWEQEGYRYSSVMEAITDFIIYCMEEESLTKDEWINILKQKREELEEEFGSDESLTDEQITEIVDALDSYGSVRPKKMFEMNRTEFIFAIYDHIQILIDMVSDYPSHKMYTRTEWKKALRRYCDKLAYYYPLDLYETLDDAQITWIIDYLDENDLVRH